MEEESLVSQLGSPSEVSRLARSDSLEEVEQGTDGSGCDPWLRRAIFRVLTHVRRSFRRPCWDNSWTHGISFATQRLHFPSCSSLGTHDRLTLLHSLHDFRKYGRGGGSVGGCGGRGLRRSVDGVVPGTRTPPRSDGDGLRGAVNGVLPPPRSDGGRMPPRSDGSRFCCSVGINPPPPVRRSLGGGRGEEGLRRSVDGVVHGIHASPRSDGDGLRLSVDGVLPRRSVGIPPPPPTRLSVDGGRGGEVLRRSIDGGNGVMRTPPRSDGDGGRLSVDGVLPTPRRSDGGRFRPADGFPPPFHAPLGRRRSRRKRAPSLDRRRGP